MSRLTNPSDDAAAATRRSLISRIKNPEDAVGWEEFFKTYWRMIRNQGLRSGLREAQAEELVQIVLISVAKNIGSFRSDPAFGSFRNWLYTLTRWRIEDLRKADRRRPMGLDEAFPGASGREETGTSAEGQVMDHGLSPSEALDLAWAEDWEMVVQARTLELFRRAVSDPKKYQVFVEYVVRETPPFRVARSFGVNIAQVYLIKHRLEPKYRAAREQAELEAEKPTVPSARSLEGGSV